ncbi:MAG: hypothetical protein RM021_015970 [Nostoc sp. EkiNYC01]|nr:hypothetical protein [Nostoc sp. EkiNYC01]
MKVLRLVLPALLLLGTPAMAVEFKGQNIDGQKLPARAYYYATGGLYKVQVSFHNKRATIYFDDGNQTTIQLNQQVIRTYATGTKHGQVDKGNKGKHI